jgi:hypothetical protein
MRDKMRCNNKTLGNTTSPRLVGTLEPKSKWTHKAKNSVMTKVTSLIFPRTGLLSQLQGKENCPNSSLMPAVPLPFRHPGSKHEELQIHL